MTEDNAGNVLIPGYRVFIVVRPSASRPVVERPAVPPRYQEPPSSVVVPKSPTSVATNLRRAIKSRTSHSAHRVARHVAVSSHKDLCMQRGESALFCSFRKIISTYTTLPIVRFNVLYNNNVMSISHYRPCSDFVKCHCSDWR